MEMQPHFFIIITTYGNTLLFYFCRGLYEDDTLLFCSNYITETILFLHGPFFYGITHSLGFLPQLSSPLPLNILIIYPRRSEWQNPLKIRSKNSLPQREEYADRIARTKFWHRLGNPPGRKTFVFVPAVTQAFDANSVLTDRYLLWRISENVNKETKFFQPIHKSLRSNADFLF